MSELADEIKTAAADKRAAGAHPPGLDRELDWAFENVVRDRPGEDRLTHALWSVSASAHITADAGLGETASPAKRFAKRVLAKLVRWYILRITNQVTNFANATASSLRLLSDRVEALAEEVASLAPAPGPGLMELERGRRTLVSSPLERHAVLADAALSTLAAAAKPGGRVLHADCRDGAFVARLAAAGVDAYGVEPSAELLAKPAGKGLDLVQGDVISHLRNAPFRSLAGALVTGSVDRLSVRDARRLAFLLGARLAPGGVVVIVSTHPAAWEAEASPVERDLQSGRPLHPETWRHLLGEHSIGEVEIVNGPDSQALATARPGTPAAYLLTGTRAT